MRLSFCLLLSLYILSCGKDNRQPAILVKASVFNVHDLSCNLPVLEFSEDSTIIKKFTGKDHFVFDMIGLPSNLNVSGKKLTVSVSLLRPEEDFFCNTLGLFYPHLKVNYAAAR